MATSFYKGVDTYVIFAEDTAWGTAGTPTGSNYVDKVTSFTGNVLNNMIRVQGMGDGRNATTAVNGGLDCSGSLGWELTDPAFLQYCVGAVQAGAGTAGDPYEIQEVNEIGYDAGQMNTISLEVGSNGGSNDDTELYDGVVFNSSTINFNQGETIKCSSEWIGRTMTSSTAVETYIGPTNRPFTFVDGSIDIGGTNLGKLSGGTITITQGIAPFRSMGSRLIQQPVFGVRRYEFTLIFKHYYDSGSIHDGIDMRSLIFKGIVGETTPYDGAQNTAESMSLDLVEGAGSGDRVVNLDFENVYFNSISEPRALGGEEGGGGVFEFTVTGFALAGLTDGSDKVPIRWWTIT